MNIKWNFKERREPELKIIRSKENEDLIIVPIEKINHKEDSDNYFTREYYSHPIKIIKEKGENNMEELIFKEVITNIKDGETWESETSYINKRKGVINIWDNTPSKTVKSIADDILFTLQERKEYTFEEAFKCFEKGREIESVVSGKCFKIRDSVSVYITKDKTINTVNDEIRLFTHNEIRGKWYVND